MSAVSGGTCSINAISDVALIFQAVCASGIEGRALVLQAGGKQIFSELLNSLQKYNLNHSQLTNMIEFIMRTLVEGIIDDQTNTQRSMMREEGEPESMIASSIGPQPIQMNTFNQREGFISQNHQVSNHMTSFAAASIISNHQINLIQTNFHQNQTSDNYLAAEIQYSHQDSRIDLYNQQASVNNFVVQPSIAINPKIGTTNNLRNTTARGSEHLQAMIAQSGVSQVHMELIHKQQLLKEECDLPFISLNETDEKLLFDMAVAIKFGNPQTIFKTCQQLQLSNFLDFPPEIYLQRTDILKNLLDLLEGSQQQVNNQNAGHDIDLVLTAQQTWITFLNQLKKTYLFLLNNGCKPSQISNRHEFIGGDKPQDDEFVDAYIKETYPCNRLSRWELPDIITQRDQARYGTSTNMRLHTASSMQANVAAGGQNSLSVRAVFSLILTKSIFLLRDTERIGIFTTLIYEALDALQKIFVVENNPQFSELIHISLIAFDKVCDFYRDQMLDEVLIQPCLVLIVRFVDLLNSIPDENSENEEQSLESSSQSIVSKRSKAPFTIGLIQSTENLQRLLRRCLFRYHFPEQDEKAEFQVQSYKIILTFFERCEIVASYSQEGSNQSLLICKGVRDSFQKSQESFARFMRVTQFKVGQPKFLPQKSTESLECFVQTRGEYQYALKLLEDLSGCFELKTNFPFEHILLDCIQFEGLLEETEHQDQTQLGDVEKFVKLYLTFPDQAIRERILRRFYTKLRSQASMGAENDSNRPKSLQNPSFLARFILRRGILSHLINGILINKEISTNEESQLQISLGQLITKSIILSVNLLTPSQLSTLTPFLLTFQCLLMKYPELLAIIEIIEEGGSKNCRFLRILRDLFSVHSHQREFATSVLKSSLSETDEEIFDLLKQTFDLKETFSKVQSNLELINSAYDYSQFGIFDIANILQSSKQDYQIKKSSLEQLTMLLFDVTNKRAKVLFEISNNNISTGILLQDVFTFCVEQILSTYNTSKTVLKRKINGLGRDHILFINEVIRFMFYSYIFYNQEPVVSSFFDLIKIMQSSGGKQQRNKDQLQQLEKFEEFLQALIFFCGSIVLRENSLLLLYSSIYQQLWICTKLSKINSNSSQRQLTVLIPDFCNEAIHHLIPYTIQTIRMPMRDDLLLSDEQKMYITQRSNDSIRRSQYFDQLSQVRQMFINECQTQFRSVIEPGSVTGLRKVLRSGLKIYTEYSYAIGGMPDSFMNQQTQEAFVDLLKVLPTRDFEFYEVGDYLFNLKNVLKSLVKRLFCPSYEKYEHACGINFQFAKQTHANFSELFLKISDGLKYHLIPYLEETGAQNLSSSEQTAKSYLLTQYFELIENMLQVDLILNDKKLSLADLFSRSSFVNYLLDVYKYTKFHKFQIINIWIILMTTQYKYKDQEVISNIIDVLVDDISATKMIYNQFENCSFIIKSFKLMISLANQRLLITKNLQMQVNEEVSQVAKNKIEMFRSFGWILRFTEARDVRIRTLTWDLLVNLFDFEFLKTHSSVIHQAINSYLKNQELFCVKIVVLKFLNKVCLSLLANSEEVFMDKNENSSINITYGERQDSKIEEMSVKTMLDLLNRRGLISQVHKILSRKDYPLLFLTLTLQLLYNLTQMDYKKAYPVLTQLDYWTFLVELLDIDQLQQIERSESRQILGKQRHLEIQGQTSGSLLRYEDPCRNQDLVQMSINSLLEFIFSAMKRDSQLAALLVKTTRLIPSLFNLLTKVMEEDRHQQLKFNNYGLLTVFVDKSIKIFHISLFHPQDYSFDLLSRFIFDKPLLRKQENDLQVVIVQDQNPRNWSLLLQMFKVIEGPQNYGQYSSQFEDIKFSLIRFISEFLIQSAHFQNNFLDELIPQQGDQGIKEDDQQVTYGSQLFIEFAKVFKILYSGQNIQKQQNQLGYDENCKKDLQICLSILFSSCQSAKTCAVDQGFLKRLIDISAEHITAINLGQLSKMANGQFSQNDTSVGKQRAVLVDKQLKSMKKFKFVQDASDFAFCEREAIRMLVIQRNLFFDSKELLTHDILAKSQQQTIQQSIGNTSRQGRFNVIEQQQSLGELIIQKYSQMLEELGLGTQKSFQNLLSECLLTLITFMSQSQKLKNLSIMNIELASSNKKQSLLKLIVDMLQFQSTSQSQLQGGTKLQRLLFTLLRTISISGEVVKDLPKHKFVEEVVQRLQIACKTDSEIKLHKSYLTYLLSFFAAMATSEEGRRQLSKLKGVFEFALYLLDTVTIPQTGNSLEMSPISVLVASILLFLRNSTLDSRQNKVHLLRREDFWPNLISFLGQETIHPKVKAYTAAVLWSSVHNHQGVKAAINKPVVIQELQNLRQEYHVASQKLSLTDDASSFLFGKVNQEYHANYDPCEKQKEEEAKLMVSDMMIFISQALNGVLTLLQS